MRIVVNDIAASMGGAMTILKQFYNFIKEKDSTNEWIFLLGDNYLDETKNIRIITLPHIKESKLKKIIFDCFCGKKFINSLNPDVVISLQNIITFGVNCPQIVYIHQSIPFQNMKNFSLLKNNERSLALIQYCIGYLIKKSAKKADKVAVQTDWMKDAVADKTGILRDKIIKVFPEVSVFNDSENTLDFDCKKFFYPTNNELYKNIDTIIDACNILNQKGYNDFTVNLTLPQNTIIHKNIKCINRLDRTQMHSYYKSSTLLFTSYIETVGLPLLEARSCGSLIIAANTPFAKECLKNYRNASLYDTFSAESLASKMIDIIDKRKIPMICDNTIPSEKGWDCLYQTILSYKNN